MRQYIVRLFFAVIRVASIFYYGGLFCGVSPAPRSI